MKKDTHIVPTEVIERKIHVIRGVKVMLDRDLAILYSVQTFRLNEAVKRNKNRFPSDFMFQLTNNEYKHLISQIAISKTVRGGRRTLPYVFTEQGVAMLASVLNSKKAIKVNIAIVRAFIKLREMLQSHKDVLVEIEKIKRNQKKSDEKISEIINVINKLLAPEPSPKKETIGFKTK